jgi:hypothetical protein
MTYLIGFVVGLLVAIYVPQFYRLGRSAWSKWRMGICFHYQPTGYRETRDGTNSDFCRRCGHPAGYHR